MSKENPIHGGNQFAWSRDFFKTLDPIMECKRGVEVGPSRVQLDATLTQLSFKTLQEDEVRQWV